MPETLSQEIVVAVGVCARIAAAVVTGTLPILPGGSFRIRLTLAFALAVVAVPMALAGQAAYGSRPIGPLLPVLAGELLVGLLMGTAAAAVLAATAWAGGILGSVSGLSWADDFDPAAAGESAGIARLAWWVGLAAFFAAGGQLAVVGGLIDSVRHVPIGAAFGGPPQEWLVRLSARNILDRPVLHNREIYTGLREFSPYNFTENRIALIGVRYGITIQRTFGN